MQKRWFILGIILVVLMACNLPGENATAPSQDAIQTAAAMTVQAALAQPTNSGQANGEQENAPTTAPQNTLTPVPAVTVLPTSTPLPAPTATPLPTATPTPKPCNLATFIKDVTVPDGTVFKPGDHFTKTWRLKNVGTCTWHNYALVFDSGKQMSAPPSVAIPGTVAPGQVVDVSVDFVAPNTDGTYKSNWRLRDDKGVVFGLTTGNPFWVEIKVVSPTAPPPTPTAKPTLPPPAMMVLDFYAEAPQAMWSNDNGGTMLPFPGSDGDSRGFARYVDAYMLEDGQTHPRALETHPEWVSDGYIVGAYEPVTLPAHAHFRAKLGFIATADGGCGAGDVTFRLVARTTNSAGITLGEWHKTCNGSLLNVDVDLSAYAGQRAAFMLIVNAGASSGQDWAVWVNPVIATP